MSTSQHVAIQHYQQTVQSSQQQPTQQHSQQTSQQLASQRPSSMSPPITTRDYRPKQPTTYQYTNRIHPLTTNESTLSSQPVLHQHSHHKMSALGPSTRLSSSQLMTHQPPNQTNQLQGTSSQPPPANISIS